MKIFATNLEQRRAAVNGLAVVGFVALIIIGMWFAVYSARFVPSIANRIGSAAVYLGSVFTPSESPALTIIPMASSTVISFGNGTSTAATTTSSTPVAPAKPVTPTAGHQTATTTRIGGTAPASLYGLPDLVVTIKKVGYLATTSASSFIASSTVPAGSRPAVTFSIKNIGTNATGQWYFSASIPTQTAYIYQSIPQQSLNPGDSIDYTLGFDQANKGSGKVITITANYNHAIAESNYNNNVASTTVTILGS